MPCGGRTARASGAGVVILLAPNSVSAAGQAVAVLAQATRTIARTLAFVCPNPNKAVLRQTVHELVIPFQTAIPEHPHLTAAGIKAAETSLWQKLAVYALRQRLGLHPLPLLGMCVAVRVTAIRMAMLLGAVAVHKAVLLPHGFSVGLAGPLLVLVVFVNDCTNGGQPQNGGNRAGRAIIISKGWRSGEGRHREGSRRNSTNKACGKLETHESDPLSEGSSTSETCGGYRTKLDAAPSDRQ